MQVQALSTTPGAIEPTGLDRSTATVPARIRPAEDKRDPREATPPDAQAVGQAVDSINQAMKSLSNRIEFSIDDDSKRQVVKVIDPDTKEVIRQMPSEEALAIAKALDRLQGLLIKQQA
ncbi:MAG: flagellar protein FlaG [Janthinobacterium lividum]